MNKALTASSASALIAMVFGVAQVQAQTDSVSFATEGDTTETASLAGHSCDSQDLLEAVTLNFRVTAVDSQIPGTSISGLGVENEDPVSSGEVESCNELRQVSINAVGGPSNAGISVSNPEVCLTATLPAYDGTTDFAGTSGSSQEMATNVDRTNSVTISGADLSFFTSAGFDVQFVFDARGSGSNETADAAFANGLDGGGSVTVSYSCGTAFCELPGAPDDLPADDPACAVCQFDGNLLADDPNCVAPPPVPGMTSIGLLFSLLGLPLIAGFFVRRMRNKR